jgi:thiamine-phosphate pyrophosphorylase
MIEFRLYLVTDLHALTARSIEYAVYEACATGARAVQLREKTIHTSSLYYLAQGLRRITAPRGARLFVNDRADIARAVGADGVHCPENGFSPSIARRIAGDHSLVGVSTHSLDRAVEAERAGADFITFGPVFETPSKRDYGAPQGLEKLREVTGAVRVPVFAIGGVTPKRAASCLENGAWGVAVVSAVFAPRDIGGAVRDFERALGNL